MGITRLVKGTALSAAILLMGVNAAACGGNGSSSNNLVPQRVNLVGSVEIDQFLRAIDLDSQQIFQIFSSSSLNGPEGINDLLPIDPSMIEEFLRDVSRADIFAELDVDGDSEYFGGLLHGSFDETVEVEQFESVFGLDLLKEVYKGSNIYFVADDEEEIRLSVLDSGRLAFGTGGALKDIIDLWVGDAVPASGPLIDAFDDLDDGLFGMALKVPQGAFEGEDLGSIPQLEGLPVSLDFLSSLDIVALGADLKGGSFNVTISMDFTNQGAAETLEGFIKGLVTLASGFSPDPGTAELLSGLEIDRDGRRLTITVGIPESDLSGMFGELNAATGITQSAGRPPGTPAIRLHESVIGDAVSIMPSADHVTEGQKVEYRTTPPSSGDHWSGWADCGWYPNGLPDELITHNLEHGNIVVSYNFTNPAQVTELRQVLDGVSRFEKWGVARSYDKIPDGQVALAAWGRLATSQGVSPLEIELFFEAFAGLMGPERIAC